MSLKATQSAECTKTHANEKREAINLAQRNRDSGVPGFESAAFLPEYQCMETQTARQSLKETSIQRSSAFCCLALNIASTNGQAAKVRDNINRK
ncbi:hypothetical protein STEG23_026935 [Scotinomys teguina]